MEYKDENLVAGEGAGLVQHGHSERRPPGVELLHPLVHDRGRAHDDRGTQAGVPAATHTHTQF